MRWRSSAQPQAQRPSRCPEHSTRILLLLLPELCLALAGPHEPFPALGGPCQHHPVPGLCRGRGVAASITCNEQMIKGEETEPRFGPGRLWPPCTAASSWPGPVSSATATASARAGAAAESLARAPRLRENKREVRLVQPTGRSTEGFRLEKIFHVAKSNPEPAKPSPYPKFPQLSAPPGDAAALPRAAG